MLLMGFVRLLLVVMIALSASVSGGGDIGHDVAMVHDHPVVEIADGEPPSCCSESSDRTQSCHALPALLPAMNPDGVAPDACGGVSIGAELRLAGIEPSGPLDPPRTV